MLSASAVQVESRTLIIICVLRVKEFVYEFQRYEVKIMLALF